MNIDIRNSIHDSFLQTDMKEIRTSIEEALAIKEELTLPGLGVFFEILWEKSSPEEKEQIVTKIKNGI